MRRLRTSLLFFAASTLIASQAAVSQSSGQSETTTGQCRKRILVFLDVSGSMLPTSSAPGSPFQQSVAALDQLLREPGFFGQGDDVEVIRFGAKVRGEKLRAHGREEAASLLSKLRENKESDQVTDFRSFVS